MTRAHLATWLLKCDKETPHCRNCLKSNRLCLGYKRKVGYVFSDDVRLDNDSGPAPFEEGAVAHHGRWKKTDPGPSPPAAFQVAEHIPQWADSPLSLSLSRQVSASTALRQQFQHLFLSHYMPRDSLNASPASRIVTMNWLLQLQDIEIRSPALETSLAAFLAARVGWINNDSTLVLQSRSMYVEGLKRLQQAINNPNTRLSDETLAACLALSHYEISEAPKDSGEAVMAHENGALHLLELRGPEASTSALGHSLFLELRARAVCFRTMCSGPLLKHLLTWDWRL